MGTSQAFQDKIIETNNENIHNEVAIAIGDSSGLEEASDSRQNLDEPENSIENSQDNCESVRVDKKHQMLELNVDNLLASQSDKIDINICSPSVHTKERNMQDTVSLASASSSGSLSSASSVCSNSKVNVKIFSPANENADSQYQNQNQSHHRIRRVPSTANPKHRVPTLGRTQRSKSQPHINFPNIQSQRRNSSPNPLSFQGVPNVHGTPLVGNKTNFPNVNQVLQHLQQSQQINQSQNAAQSASSQHQQQSRQATQQQQQQQQQIIYLQIPQPPQSQAYDPQMLQSQISSQLQQLVPQIYSLLLNQITSPTLGSSSKNSSNQNNHKTSESMQPNFSGEVQSQRVTNQILEQNYNSIKSSSRQKSSSQTNQPKRSKSNVGVKPTSTSNNPTVETINETEDLSKYIQLDSLSQILQQIPSHILQQNHNSSKASYIEIQQLPGCPKITIPITQELLNQCQQYQQQRDVEYVPYHPSLETILEESLSVKHLKINTFPKTKIIACVLTVLCVIVVVLLAGDKTIAVVVVAVIFIIFLLASIFYLYVNSTKSIRGSPFSHSDSQRIQVTGLSSVCDKASMQV